MSKAEAELHRKHGEARAHLLSEEDTGATQEEPDPPPAARPEPEREEAEPSRLPMRPVAEPLPQESYGSAPAPPPLPTFAPSYYPPEQNYYGGFMEDPAVDTAGYYWPPSDVDPWAGVMPFSPEYSGVSSPYNISSPISGAYSPYQMPGLFWSMPPPMPYQAPLGMPMMPLPFYGYPGSYSPGYPDFLPLYSGYPNYPVFPYASANPYAQPEQDARGAGSPPPQAEAVRAPSTERSAADAAPSRRAGPSRAQSAPAEKRKGRNPGNC
ncbi:hypothetical protein V5799_009493 [Amblyomma americanum]|uniref:Uncharacterized protein n=1 Tax=Amblyomma americanum TaxID=6943 RepID=A0AAQ4FBI9_AMBAM